MPCTVISVKASRCFSGNPDMALNRALAISRFSARIPGFSHTAPLLLFSAGIHQGMTACNLLRAFLLRIFTKALLTAILYIQVESREEPLKSPTDACT